MTAAGTAGNRWPQDGRLNRLVMWLGHYQEYFLFAALAAATWDFLADLPAALNYLSDAAWLAWAVAYVFGGGQHMRQLCERCVGNAPVLDPEGAVSRWRPALWCYHREWPNKVLALAAVGWFIGVALVIRHVQLWQHAIDTLMLAGLAYIWFVRRVHGRLYPWCPWCRWDNGGEEEVSPSVPDVPAVR